LRAVLNMLAVVRALLGLALWVVPALSAPPALAAPASQPEQKNTQHSEVQDIVDAIVRGEGSVNNQLMRARALGKEGEVARRLEEIALRVSDPERLRNIALVLVALGQASGEGTLVRMMQSKDPGTRMYAAQGLGQLKSKQAAPKLV